MKILSMMLSVVALPFLFSTPSAAVGKITIDPNTPEALAKAQALSGFWTADSRLTQKISLEAKRQSVSSIISQISQKAGIKIETGLGDQDWQVRDRKMIIFAKDMPVADLMQSIARVMKFDWKRTQSDGVYSYRLFMDRNTLINAEAQSYREEQRFYQEQCQKRADFSEKLKDFADLSEQDLAKLKEEDPMMYALAASGVAESLGRIFGEAKGMRDAFVSGDKMTMNLSSESDGMKAAMLNMAKAMARMAVFSSDLSEEDFDSNPDLLKEISVQPPHVSEDRATSDIVSLYMLGEIDLMYKRTGSSGEDLGFTENGFPIFDPDSVFGKEFGRLFTQVLDKGVQNLGEISMNVKIDPDDLLKRDFGEPAVKHDKDENIPGEVDLSQNGKNGTKPFEMIDQLALFTNASGLNVISDYFVDEPLNTSTDKIPSIGILKWMELLNSYNWWRRGSTIELRDRHWFHKRSLEIPEAWLVKWRDNFKSAETLDIDDLADMAVLIGETNQWKMNISKDDILACDPIKWTLYLQKDFLRFYASLSQSQRAAIYTKEGLDLTNLSGEQKQIATKRLGWWDGKRSAVIFGTRMPLGKQFKYSFNTGGRNFGSITTPKYTVNKPS